MISQGWKKQRRPEEAAPLQVKRVSTQPRQALSRRDWLDSMLGQGSAKTVDSAVSRFSRAKTPEAAPAPMEAPRKTLRMRAVGSEPEPAARNKPKGYLRLAVAAAVLLLLLIRLKPWHAAASITMPELVHVVKKAESEPKTPLIDAGGSPIALWRSETGNWYGLNAKAELSRMSEKEANARLDLPRLEGASVSTVEKHGGHIMALGVDVAQLNELLPLRDELAAEIDRVELQGKSFRLRTHSGSVADLGEGDYKKKEARLAAVLADLGARKKRAASVDLRFENSAVVRLASR